MAVALILFSGCSARKQTARQTIYEQNQLIRKQQIQLNELRERLLSYKKNRPKKRTTSLSATTKTGTAVNKNKKKIKLEKVEDHNFNSNYMYPETKSKPKKEAKSEKKQASADVDSTMGKAECITLIGQDKFDKYTKMFGSEAASIKRCKMLKAM